MTIEEIIKNAEEKKALAYSKLQKTKGTLTDICGYYMETHNAFCDLLNDIKQLSCSQTPGAMAGVCQFKCLYCDKSFAYVDDLQTHIHEEH